MATQPIQYIGELIDRVTTSVRNFGVHPRSDVVVRIGDFGPEMQIEHVKVQGGAGGPRIVLQLKTD